MKYCSDKKCPYSQVSYPDHFGFCPTCGKELVAVKKCSCGREIEPVYNFCPKCGKKER